MSRPLAWNGSGWVDSAFHIGSGQYKQYIPPVYDQQACSSEFTTGLDGFTYQGTTGGTITHDPAGYATVWGPGGYLQDFGYRCDRANSNLDKYAGRSVRLDVRYRFPDGVPGNQMSLMGWVWEFDRYPPTTLEIQDEYLQADGQWHNLSSPAQTLRHYTGGTGKISTRLLIYGGGTIQVDYTRAVDVATGEILMALGNPGWEPKVYRTDGTWK